MTSLTVSVLLASVLATQPAAERTLPFSDKGWSMQGERMEIVKEGERDVLQVETGFAHRKDVQFEDGTIEFDVQVTNRRSFVYVYFRTLSDGEREEFYLRPHKSELPDAVQYAPVFQGRSSWQLYHGPGGTASVAFEPGVWTKVRLVVKGSSAALFVKDMEKPALLVPRLSREPRAGSISLGGFVPPDTPGAGPIARFANVRITPGAVPFDLESAAGKATQSPTAAETAAAGVIRSWSVSRSYVPKDTPGVMATLPGPEITGGFRQFGTYPGGLLELHRHVQVPKGSRATAAVARVHVLAASAGTYALELGFSDIATVFLNGRPLYRGDATYSFDEPRREGLIEYQQARLYLPLNAGDNELAVVVSDVFGGWGLMARWVDARGLTVDAR
jgi:hypothetical protein